MCIADFARRGCFKSKNGWYRVVKWPKINEEAIWKIGATLGGQTEVGWHRMAQDVLAQLWKTRKAFRWPWLERWAKDIASFEFGVSLAPEDESGGNDLLGLDMLQGKSRSKFALCPPHQGAIYEQKKRDGIL